jgi:hypothetical protein
VRRDRSVLVSPWVRTDRHMATCGGTGGRVAVRVDVRPAQRPGLLGADPAQKAQHDVGVHQFGRAAECDQVLTGKASGKLALRPAHPGHTADPASGKTTVDLPLGWKVENWGMRITRNEVRRLVDVGAQLVEVLPRDEFDDEHLPGAISLQLKSLTAETSAILDRARPVIVYCWDGL